MARQGGREKDKGRHKYAVRAKTCLQHGSGQVLLDLCELHFTRQSVRVFLCVFVAAPLPSCPGRPGEAGDAFMAPSLPPSSSNMPRRRTSYRRCS